MSFSGTMKGLVSQSNESQPPYRRYSEVTCKYILVKKWRTKIVLIVVTVEKEPYTHTYIQTHTQTLLIVYSIVRIDVIVLFFILYKKY